MRYCVHCGEKIADDAKFCPACGKKVEDDETVANQANTNPNPEQNINNNYNNGFVNGFNNSNNIQPSSDLDVLALITKVLLILCCIGSGWMLIPLCWTIPMTVYYWRAVSNGQKVGVGFKVCTLIFINIIPGILMLCNTKY